MSSKIISYLDEKGLTVLAEEIKKITAAAYKVQGDAIYADDAYLADPAKEAAIDSKGVWQKKDGTYKKIITFTVGWVYNIINPFTTDADFVEGAGTKAVAGMNIVVVNTGTEAAPVLKFDLLSLGLSLDAYQTKKLLNPLTVFESDYSYAAKADLPTVASAAPTVQTMGVNICTDADEAGDAYRAIVDADADTITWVKLGNQNTVEGALEFLGSTAPNRPISEAFIRSLFA